LIFRASVWPLILRNVRLSRLCYDSVLYKAYAALMDGCIRVSATEC